MNNIKKYRENIQETRYLDNIDAQRISRGLSMISPRLNDIKSLLKKAGQEIPNLASLESVQAVYNHNPDSIMCIVRNGPDGTLEKPTAFIAQLPLNENGQKALFSGELNLTAPDIKYVSRQDEKVSCIYVWLIYLTPSTAGGIGLIVQRMNMPNYQAANIYCRPIDARARTFFSSLGFISHQNIQENGPRGFMAYFRRQNNLDMKTEKTTVEIVRTIEGFQKVIVIRAATYIAEQECPFDEEYDGNDFAASHLIGYFNNEPAACIRIRFFAGFAKIERLAVIKRFRNTRLSHELIEAAKNLAQQKGYSHLYGQAEPNIVKLWVRHGFIPRTQEPTISFSGRKYIEGDLFLPPINSAISAHSHPEIINRPEGEWDRPGILEQAH